MRFASRGSDGVRGTGGDYTRPGKHGNWS